MTDSSPRANRRYGNFRNPFGLVFRMLRSGVRPAYSALFREALKLLAWPLDMLLSPFEARRITASESVTQPLIFIVGPPRSGTTMVYQVLAYCLDVSYPTNMSALFPRSPITVSRLFQRLLSKRKPDFQSFYGQTAHFRGPNDAFHIWNRWLGSDRYLTTTNLPDSVIENMQRFFNAWTATTGRPFLNKNNRNTQCCEFLASQLPTAYFVVVRRDPVCIARSLIRARADVQGDKRIGWGLQSQEDHSEADPLGYVHDVCGQIRNIEQRLSEQLAKIDSDRVFEMTYEEFCENPRRCVAELVGTVPGLAALPQEATLEAHNFQVSTSLPLTDEEEKIIRAELATAA